MSRVLARVVAAEILEVTVEHPLLSESTIYYEKNIYNGGYYNLLSII